MDGKVVIGTELDTKSFEAQIDEVEGKLEEINDMLSKPKDFNLTETDITKLNVEAEKLSNKLVDLKRKQVQLNEVTKDYGNSLQKTVKKISKWGLAIFGIRSAYLFILKTAREIGNENEEVGAKLDSIKNSLTNLLAPAVEVIVNLVYRLLAYLNVITKSFLGIDLFKKSANSAKSAVGSAEKLKKTLAGFDEMNVLADTSTSGGGGAETTFEPEPIDTSNLENYVEKFKGMWNELLETDRTTMAQIYLENDSTWGLLNLGWFDTIQGLVFFIQGIIDVVKGVFDIIIGIANGDEEKIHEGVQKLLGGLGKIIRGSLQSLLGLVEMTIGLLWGIIVTIVKWINDKIIKPIGNAFKFLWEALKDGFKGAIDYVKNIFISVINFFRNIISTIVGLFQNIGTKVGDVIGGAFKTVINGVLRAIENILNFPIRSINSLIGVINKIPGINIGRLSTFNLPRLAKGGIVNLPGKGVPVGNAITGERGQEGVIPLTDSQQMALLGEAIGKYITINANITNTMNGRVISRELQKINNESNFAFNR